MRWNLVLVGALGMAWVGSCDLYRTDIPISLELQNFQPIVTDPDLHLDYRIRGAFHVDMRVQALNPQGQWVNVSDMNQRLREAQGTLRWNQPLSNTRYRLTFRAVASRSGLEKVLDPPFREDQFDVVLQPLNVQTVNIVPGSKVTSGPNPVSIQFLVKAYGLRPSAQLILIDTSYTYSPSLTSYEMWMPGVYTLGIHVFGSGVKIADLGGGLEDWLFTIPFDCHSPPYAIDGTNGFSVGDTIYLMVVNASGLDPNNPMIPNQVYPNPYPWTLTSWPSVTWP